MLRFVVIASTVLLLLNIITIEATNVKRCKNGQPFPLSVDIDDCDEPPCVAIKGTVAEMKVHFVGTKDNIRNLTAHARATTLGITVPYELPSDVSDVCSNLLHGAICPIDKTEDVVYKFDMFLELYYPEIVVKVELSLLDETNESIACFMVDVKVKKGATSGGGRGPSRPLIKQNHEYLQIN